MTTQKLNLINSESVWFKKGCLSLEIENLLLWNGFDIFELEYFEFEEAEEFYYSLESSLDVSEKRAATVTYLYGISDARLMFSQKMRALVSVHSDEEAVKLATASVEEYLKESEDDEGLFLLGRRRAAVMALAFLRGETETY